MTPRLIEVESDPAEIEEGWSKETIQRYSNCLPESISFGARETLDGAQQMRYISERGGVYA
jgi:hypothetical protein